jgi:hypothetical protein
MRLGLNLMVKSMMVSKLVLVAWLQELVNNFNRANRCYVDGQTSFGESLILQLGKFPECLPAQESPGLPAKGAL